MKIKDVIFFGGRSCMEECYHLHRRMEEAFEILGGIQQPPRPCNNCEQGYDEAEIADGETDIHLVADEIVKGLLGKDYKIVRDKPTEGN